MWCGNCHQDVPGVAHAASGRLVCSRCQQPVAGSDPHASRVCDDGIELTESLAAVKNSSPPLQTDWTIRQRARELDRALRRPLHIALPKAHSLSAGHRIEPRQGLFETLDNAVAPTIAMAGRSESHTPSPRPITSVAGQVFAWLVVMSGAAALIAGVSIIGWSHYAKKAADWNLALSLALGGQGALIFGLVLVVSRLWRNSRYATNRLQEMHARLARLQNTADSIIGMRSSGAPAFYAELARGASPQMLLSNLKGQLDQLATRFGS
jgi:hypothetical protein